MVSLCFNEAQRQLSPHTVANNAIEIRSQFCSVWNEGASYGTHASSHVNGMIHHNNNK